MKQRYTLDITLDILVNYTIVNNALMIPLKSQYQIVFDAVMLY